MSDVRVDVDVLSDDDDLGIGMVVDDVVGDSEIVVSTDNVSTVSFSD